MAGTPLVLSDASPLIALSWLDALGWLRSLFGDVAVPPEVWAEVQTGRGKPGEPALQQALDAGWLRLTDPSPSGPALPELDEGESACIRIALAHAGPALLLMDERAGRQVAQEHGLRVAGTAAVIGMAKNLGLIASARDTFERLRVLDFRISAEVIATVLRRTGEMS